MNLSMNRYLWIGFALNVFSWTMMINYIVNDTKYLVDYSMAFTFGYIIAGLMVEKI